jgi:stearoyl-CoA desaturase (delta-9 desaturase)
MRISDRTKLTINLLNPFRQFATILQLLLPVSIYLGVVSNADAIWWIVAVFFYIVIYTMIGNNIALHRYFTHGHFTIARPVEYFFAWCGSMIGMGDPLSYAMTHTVHHNSKYTDTPLDPHGPSCGLRSVLFCFQRPINPSITPVFNRHVLELSKKYWWLHRYYVPIVLANAALLWVIDYKVFLFCWLIPASISIWGIGFAVLRQHWPMKANNCRTHLIEPWYEGLHLNHHNWPMAPNTAIYTNEIDYTYQFSKIFFPKFNTKGQP